MYVILYICYIWFIFTLTPGILLNLNEADISPHMETIIKTISEVLDIDHVQLLKLTLESQEQSEGVSNFFLLKTYSPFWQWAD